MNLKKQDLRPSRFNSQLPEIQKPKVRFHRTLGDKRAHPSLVKLRWMGTFKETVMGTDDTLAHHPYLDCESIMRENTFCEKTYFAISRKIFVNVVALQLF